MRWRGQCTEPPGCHACRVVYAQERPFLAAELQVELEAVLRTCQDNELIVSEVTVAALSASNFGRKDVKQQQQVYTDEVKRALAQQRRGVSRGVGVVYLFPCEVVEL